MNGTDSRCWTNESVHDTDVLVVGGGAAGLSASLVLGRDRRNVSVVDAWQPTERPYRAHAGIPAPSRPSESSVCGG